MAYTLIRKDALHTPTRRDICCTKSGKIHVNLILRNLETLANICQEARPNLRSDELTLSLTSSWIVLLTFQSLAVSSGSDMIQREGRKRRRCWRYESKSVIQTPRLSLASSHSTSLMAPSTPVPDGSQPALVALTPQLMVGAFVCPITLAFCSRYIH